MNSRERVQAALEHRAPDRVPLDLGATAVTGIAAGALTRLRDALGLEERLVRVHEPYQMLGTVDDDVLDALGVDCVGLGLDGTFFGFPAKDWKPFALSDGTPVLVPGLFNTEKEPDGTLYQYPLGDKQYPASGRMPPGGLYHDSVDRQITYDEDNLDPEEWVRDMYSVYTDEILRELERRADRLYNQTSRALVAGIAEGSFGDIAWVPAPGAPNPKGIRGVADWYMATVLHKDYIKGIFDLELEIGMKNLEMLWQALGSKISVMMISGTDFGTQRSAFISPKAYREMYKPYHKAMNDWIHENTTWKTFYHSCGSMVDLYDEFVDAGVDIVNPVQIAATGMDPAYLKERWGDDLVFWGGGIDTQQVLPFGTPKEIDEQVKQNMAIFGSQGGFVFNAVHNIQAGVPTENLVALFEAVAKYR